MLQIEPSLENAELIAFVTIVDAGSLTRAAAELRMPRATLGRRLARLEERLSKRLLLRTTRSLSLTEAGETFYRHARLALDAVARAEASVRDEDEAIRGSLRISAPPFGDALFDEFLLDFAEAHPEVRMQVHFGSRHVDLLRDGYDVAIRAGTVAEEGLIVRRLIRAALIAVATPAYLARSGTPRTVGDLGKHRCLMGFDRNELPARTWPGRRGEQGIDGAFFTNGMRLLVAAARRDMGIAMVPENLVQRDLDEGRLVPVLPKALRREAQISVVYPERDLVPRQVRAFVDAMIAFAPRMRELATDR